MTNPADKFKAKRTKRLDINTEFAQKYLKTKLLNVKDGLIYFRKLRDNGYVRELKKSSMEDLK